MGSVMKEKRKRNEKGDESKKIGRGGSRESSGGLGKVNALRQPVRN